MAKRRKREEVWEEFEEEVFGLLQNAFHRQECAARAAARLERLVVDRYTEEQVGGVISPEEAWEDEEEEASFAGQASREFSANQFLSMFTSVNIIHLVKDMLNTLGLSQLEDEVLSVLVHESFGGRTVDHPVGRSSGEGELFIGNDQEHAFHELRKAAARAQRRR